jgi:meso-butanediol dehydrogenase / (S,S)-butanediol dehydrogenase / diacetyl reductase
MASTADQLIDGPGPLLEGRIAVITGSGGGIGAGAARLFARHGASVVIVDIDENKALSTAEEINATGAVAYPLVLDVCDPAQVETLRTEVLGRFGTVDVLVNNVGDWIRAFPSFSEEGLDHWEALYRVNFLHVLLVTHAFLPTMVSQGNGSIINVSSVEGLRGYPADVVYGAYKAAVVQFTRSLGVQVGHQGVRVNGIGPDLTETPQVRYSEWVPPEQQSLWPIWAPVGRVGEPVDQARVLLFLASDLSAFVTGLTIPTDGGTQAAGGWYRSSSRGPDRPAWTNRPLSP